MEEERTETGRRIVETAPSGWSAVGLATFAGSSDTDVCEGQSGTDKMFPYLLLRTFPIGFGNFRPYPGPSWIRGVYAKRFGQTCLRELSARSR